jgi:hypothetical protein
MKVLLWLSATTLLFFGVLSLLGMREDAGFLSGTHVPSLVGGLLYVAAYFATILAVPVVMLAAALMVVTGRISRACPLQGRGATQRSPPDRLMEHP